MFARDELPLQPILPLQPFEKWTINFIDPISPPTQKFGARYIIIGVEYLTQWVEIEIKVMKYCTTLISSKFIYENIITRFQTLIL